DVKNSVVSGWENAKSFGKNVGKKYRRTIITGTAIGLLSAITLLGINNTYRAYVRYSTQLTRITYVQPQKKPEGEYKIYSYGWERAKPTALETLEGKIEEPVKVIAIKKAPKVKEYIEVEEAIPTKEAGVVEAKPLIPYKERLVGLAFPGEKPFGVFEPDVVDEKQAYYEELSEQKIRKVPYSTPLSFKLPSKPF
ncbi:hypothetical protein B6U80_02530, partial [Candidatus Pacearchaeota archaeon ex4484_26]